MKERPILFSSAMVRALLAGTKTQTRRAAKIDVTMGRESILAPHLGKRYAPVYLLPENAIEAVACCPYGQPGDRLWVRESFAHVYRTNTEPPARSPEDVAYMADGLKADPYVYGTWKPSIHMPRWASRITLEITSVRVERLQDISEADAKAEGITPHDVRQFWLFGASEARRASIYREAAVEPYRQLWESINGPGSWGANPWVWAVEFRKVTP